ncbi:MAG: hypothetical protein RBR28_05985 [Lentimicrobium sp.]|jgi:hypothetical protein|nr:hypothetical protein [Lentimicrobium sp.]
MCVIKTEYWLKCWLKALSLREITPAIWNTTDVPEGEYYLILNTGKIIQIQKVIHGSR